MVPGPRFPSLLFAVRRCLAVGLGALTVIAAPAATGQPGPEAATVSGAASRGVLAWADLLTSGNPADIAPFYTRVFGWTAETVGEGRDAYVRLSNRGRPVAGVAHRPNRGPGLPRTRWLGFLAVTDLAAATTQATTSGATLLMPAGHWPGRGEQAVLADPEGATFGLIAVAANETASADAYIPPGEWLWPALLAEDPFKAADFYGDLLGCQVSDDKRTPLFVGDLLLIDGGNARAGVVALPGRGIKRPGWLWFVRVADLDATVSQAEKEGGLVLHHPRIDLMGGRLAVIADPYGAVFGVIETTPTSADVARALRPHTRP